MQGGHNKLVKHDYMQKSNPPATLRTPHHSKEASFHLTLMAVLLRILENAKRFHRKLH